MPVDDSSNRLSGPPDDSGDADELYARGRVPGRTYFSGRFPARFSSEPSRRFAIRVWDADDAPRFDWVAGGQDFHVDSPPGVVTIRHEAVIQTVGTGPRRHQIKALMIEDSRDVEKVIIQRFTVESGKPHEVSISLTRAETERLLDFFRAIRVVSLTDPDKSRHNHDILDDLLHDEAARLRFLREHPEIARLLTKDIHPSTNPTADGLAKLVLESGLSKDVLQIIAHAKLGAAEMLTVAHRQRELAVFGRLLSDATFFETMKVEWNCPGAEAVWQKFFERNTWVLGYGLQYQFGAALAHQKIEQMVAGHSVAGSGKRVDALLKTLGVVNSLCFVEIKTHSTKLISREYREDVYPPSAELTGAVSQVQVTVQAALRQIGDVLRPRGDDGFPTGEILHNIAPKALVVCGSLSEFERSGEMNLPQIRSFELYRRNLVNPEVITFDELYERARYIVREPSSEGVSDHRREPR
jgi:Domain of unknown function (DUF4263)